MEEKHLAIANAPNDECSVDGTIYYVSLVGDAWRTLPRVADIDTAPEAAYYDE